MSDRKVSETLSQQKKARQDFLDLKKMQKGDMAPEPKPSEVAVLPKTFKEKLQNYWFHFKWHTIGIVFTLIVLIVLIAQCSGRTNWDMQVIYFTYSPAIDTQTAKVGDYLESISKDINGDGEVNISVVNCSVPDGNHNSQYNRTVLMKLQAMITAEPTAMLYITDSESVKYFETDTLSGIFDTEQVQFGEDFYEKTTTELGRLPDGLQIACRRIAKTLLEKDEKAAKVHKEAINILSKLQKG